MAVVRYSRLELALAAVPQGDGTQFGYYAARSPLTSGSLNEHMLAYFEQELGETGLNVTEAGYRFWMQETGLTDGLLARYTYFAGLSGLPAGTLTDHMAAVYAAG